ncbi:protein of unknown function DUF893 YccS/YhfK [Gloeothece citriformis PCC 7424]|uniref:Uncharacterized protein n=1 Tax=Gloeothece citriformis (strain PCC 7424) TaxID=65393 RepID=B7KB94_GLOC7|nr:FUSC family protein [Gloeothece citriformis]ACK71450.1 protein of unknown function DUF893 YccS/YhfK [Gloeothece citriformis PCC 7424]
MLQKIVQIIFSPQKFSHVAIAHGIQTATAIAPPIIIGHLTGHYEDSIIPAIAAFLITIIAGGVKGVHQDKIFSMIIATVGSALVVALGTITGHFSALVILLTFAIIFLCTYIDIYGAVASASVLPIAIFWLISTNFPNTLDVAGERFILLLLAGGWAVMLVFMGWLTDPYQPVRQAVLTCYEALSVFLKTIIDSIETEQKEQDKLWNIETSQAQYDVGQSTIYARNLWKTVYDSRLGKTRKEQQLLFLIHTVTEIDYTLIALSHWVVTHAGNPLFPEIVAELKPLLQDLKSLMDRFPQLFLAQRRNNDGALYEQMITELRTLKKRIATVKTDGHPPDFILALKTILNELFNELCTAIKALNYSLSKLTPVKISSLIKEIPTLKSKSFFDTWKDNFTGQSIHFTNSLRLASFTTLGMAITEISDLPRGYWIALTILLVLKPDYGMTKLLIAQRVGGTILGAILAYGLTVFLGNIWFIILVVIVTAGLAGAVKAINYGLYVFALTLMLMIMFDLLKSGNFEILQLRVLHTIIGGGLAAFAYIVWPIWQQKYLPQRLKQMFEDTLAYFHGVLSAYQGYSPSRNVLLTTHRLAELANANALAATQQLLNEPEKVRGDVHTVMIMVMHCNTLEHEVSSLWNYMATLPTIPKISGIDLLIEQVDTAFHSMINRLVLKESVSPVPDFDHTLDVIRDNLESLSSSPSNNDRVEEAYPLAQANLLVNQLHHLTHEVERLYKIVTKYPIY